MDATPSPSVLEIAARLVEIPSPQTELLEAEPQILAYLDNGVVPLLDELELTSRRDRMGNIIVEVGPADAERGVLLMGYAMTHPPAAMEDPYTARILDLPEGRALRGRGVCEQKGPLAAAIWATSALARQSELNGRLVLVVSTAGETGRHLAAEAVFEQLGRVPEIGVVAVGTGNRIALGNKGRLDVTITVRGRAAHSSSPWQAIDAIHGAREVMDRLDALPLPGTEHPGLGRVTLTPTHIRSWPEATHTVQDEVHLTYDRRVLPGEDPSVAFRDVEEALADLTPWTVMVERGPWMLPSEVTADATVVRRIQDAVGRLGHPPLEMFFSQGGLDAGYLNEAGCEAVMWGPGDVDEWHTADEKVPVEQLERAGDAYLALLHRHLGGTG